MSTPTFGSDELAQFRRTFFEECTELLADLEERLGALVAFSSDVESLNAIFRAVHSVKAGAGAFGYTVLVGFAHRFEALLDRLRDGKAELDERTLAALVAAADVFSALVDLARQGEVPADDFGADVAEELGALLDGAAPTASVARPAEAAPEAAKPAEKSYRILFRPNAELFRHANEPLYLIREMKTLGELTVDCDLSRLPPFDAFNIDDSYLGWTMTLRAVCTPAAIAEVFEFVDDECVLTIEEIAAAVEPDEASPVVAVAATVATTVAPPSDPQPSGSKPSESKAAGKTGSISSIRVDLYRVDRLVNMVGELVIAQAMLAQQFTESHSHDDPTALQGFEHLAGLTRELQECVMAIRMQPVKSVFSRMPRLVRDVGHKTGKDVRLEMAGEQTEVDKTVVEELADPLTHMIRNAVDHGIEDAAERLAAGKPAEGVIRLSAQHAGSNILIHVEDDGAGLDRDRLFAKAVEKGIVPAGAKLTGEEIDELIFAPGFSTAAAVTDVSGRGVGMDVVRRNVQALGGRVQVMSTPGKGTRFTLVIPLTLAVLDGMVVAVGWEKYILPLTSIVESFRPGRGQIRVIPGGGEVVSIRGEFVRLIHLARVFGVTEAVADPCQGLVVLIELANGGKLGVVVDELIGQQQVVIKSLQDNYDPVPGISGATILGNGRVALIVDIEELTRLYDRNARIADALRQPIAANA
ncbi:chemotaxis protein CheA [Pleomorphomonas diazotrophica]|uniref:Chemotaxis protein CheA n=1 Tax=Pleomorphomonas diazotrophica TaxID=1166257 RepID=A0A1I4T6H8_9HYPH|nr:chemotaxis protein CheA [Pleomorphomonas diazotrophica]PKR89528.1 chemotaxis protein CheA [Pleomorphomonas diazotrophica]SFM72306.1 two-component system, chemotaxis family, sensor kinase CheA [Pleomorphomonas diazotrophica]